MLNNHKSPTNAATRVCGCALLGLALLACGLAVPMHLKAVDNRVLEKAGRNSASVVQEGLALASQGQHGAAQMLSQAAKIEELPSRQALDSALHSLAKSHPDWTISGGGDPALEGLFHSWPDAPANPAFEPFTDFVVRLENRGRVLALLQASPNPLVQELLRFRLQTNTVLFSPSPSASGQALDAALSICGLLVNRGHFTASLSNALDSLAAGANRGGDSQPFEEILMSVLSLGQRLNYGQLEVFLAHIQSPETLRLLANLARNAGPDLPVLFSAVVLSGSPDQVAGYLSKFSLTGMNDLRACLPFGAGGVNELLRRNQRLYQSAIYQRLGRNAAEDPFVNFAVGYSVSRPWRALAIKWLLYLAGGFFFAMALHFAKPAVSPLEQPLQARGFHIVRELLFALGFLLVVLLLSEPFLAQDSQKMDWPFRLRLPMAGGSALAESARANPSIMNQLSLLTLLLFFVLQALLYTASLVKLAEIRRQKMPPRVKLKLLENEDHLFDAGLYLGFVGTIISLILVSLGIIKPSLMAAYSSTSFGIIFVSVFKIFHLRPLRRRLLLETEASSIERQRPAVAEAYVPML